MLDQSRSSFRALPWWNLAAGGLAVAAADCERTYDNNNKYKNDSRAKWGGSQVLLSSTTLASEAVTVWLNRLVLFWFEKSLSIHLLVSTVVTDGLVDNMAPGFFFAVLMIFCFALFVVDRVAFFNPFGFGYCHLVFAAFLTLDFFDLAYHRDCYWIAHLKSQAIRFHLFGPFGYYSVFYLFIMFIITLLLIFDFAFW